MKKILIALSTMMFITTASAEAVIKTVCHARLDKKNQPVIGKDGKAVQDCKKIKTHEKLDGTPITPKKK